ncbi:MAG: Fe-S cluster assembly protein SufD [Bdellovibrionaceae bacterium]|nr:Fe-S cluster assembly protein SufD [Pseudobdellovibrionaceae bacterium]
MSWQTYLNHAANVTTTPVLPTRRDEEWKYVSLQFLGHTDFVKAIATAPATSSSSIPSGAHEIVFVDGVPQVPATDLPFAAELIDRSKAPSAVFQSWFEAFAALKQKTFAAKGFGFEQIDVFEDQNARLWDKALFLQIPDGEVIAQPIVLRFISTSSEGVRAPRIWISASKRSKASIVEVYEGATVLNRLTLPVIEAELADSANLALTRVDRGGEGFSRIGRSRVFLRGNANLESLVFAMGSKLVRDNSDLHLVGENATARLHGLSVAGGDQVIDHHTTVDHVVGHCQTQQLYKSVLSGQSRVVFNGRVIIRHDSQKANSDQLNQSLLLSGTAEVDSKPQLEIWADDVKATHGATVGQMNEDEIFYLASRAIPRPEAESMIRQGFTRDLLMQVTNDSVREWLLTLQTEADQRLLS